MQFTSLFFFLFLSLVLFGYLLIPRKARCIWLLAASYLFCASYSLTALFFLLFSTAVTWAIGLALRKESPHKKTWLIAGILLNLGPLFVFKYADFVVRNLNLLFLRTVQRQPFDVFTTLIVPVGISFYTFQVLGYLIDVYRGKIEPEHNPLSFALFTAFFPKLLQGPIERADNLLVQIRNIETIHVWNYERITAGTVTILWGLFQKMVLADRLGLLVNNVFDNARLWGSVELILGAVAYTLQIYLDFNGYTCIAIGSAQILGFSLMENFITPYFASSVSDFWRRWHVSLSSWFRDYLYIPLGGSRVSTPRHCFNIMVTMVVSGLWHGASWNFVAWGALHGVYQVAGRLTKPLRTALQTKWKVRTQSFSHRFGQKAFTFLLVCFAWIFFRADGLYNALLYIYRMVTRWNPWVLFDGSFCVFDGMVGIEIFVLGAGLLLVWAVDALRYRSGQQLADWLSQQSLWFRWSVCIVLVLTILVFGEYGVSFDSSKFIYLQF